MKHIGKVVCGVILNHGEILIAKRPEGKSLGGFWEFPGGKVEDGETEEIALCRELKEELDLEVEVLHALNPVDYVYPSFAMTLLPYLCRAGRRILNAQEHSAVEWVSLGDIRNFEFAPADVPIIGQLEETKNYELLVG